MFDLGLRRGEVVGLDVEDVDRAGRRLWVLGNGRAQKEARTLPVPTLEAIDRSLALRSRICWRLPKSHPPKRISAGVPARPGHQPDDGGVACPLTPSSQRCSEHGPLQARAAHYGRWPLSGNPEARRFGGRQGASPWPQTREHRGCSRHQQRRRAGCSSSRSPR